jgi:hypothetical protein
MRRGLQSIELLLGDHGDILIGIIISMNAFYTFLNAYPKY